MYMFAKIVETKIIETSIRKMNNQVVSKNALLAMWDFFEENIDFDYIIYVQKQQKSAFSSRQIIIREKLLYLGLVQIRKIQHPFLH
jgi:hypothetical protein